jgi:hypothetical protein
VERLVQAQASVPGALSRASVTARALAAAVQPLLLAGLPAAA